MLFRSQDQPHPALARPSCGNLLTDIIQKITADTSNKSAWNELLLFAPVILTKPKREGARRNLSNDINKRIAEWKKGNHFESLPTAPLKIKPANRAKDEDYHLAAAIRSKLEAGNYKAAVRLICSEDRPAPTTDETIQAPRDKHPGPAPDRRCSIDPTGNTRFTHLQISPEDVRRALRTFIGRSRRPHTSAPNGPSCR